MFRLWRNVHLSLGVAFFFVAALFAASSVVIIYRPWFPGGPVKTDRAVSLAAGITAREAALALMRDHGLAGDMRQVREAEDGIRFVIWRPGEQVNVHYVPASGQAQLEGRRYNLYETLVQLHVNHGFWHTFMPANLWALLSVAFSLGLILLGASGIYLWYKHPRERRVGTVLLVIGFGLPVLTLLLMRTALS